MIDNLEEKYEDFKAKVIELEAKNKALMAENAQLGGKNIGKPNCSNSSAGMMSVEIEDLKKKLED